MAKIKITPKPGTHKHAQPVDDEDDAPTASPVPAADGAEEETLSAEEAPALSVPEVKDDKKLVQIRIVKDYSPVPRIGPWDGVRELGVNGLWVGKTHMVPAHIAAHLQSCGVSITVG